MELFSGNCSQYTLTPIIKFLTVCANEYAALSISDQGTIYSWGNDENQYGILGQGEDVKLIQNPTPISKMLNNRYSSLC